MATEIIRYALDPTGQDSNNLVQNETYTLTEDTPLRALCPIYGPFFSDNNTLIVYDTVNNRKLDKGTDYVCVELLQDATNKFGLEICSLILITNSAVGNKGEVSYQVLGGLYQNDSSALINLYDTYLKDDRPVDWANVLNKPTTFPPTLHRHLLEDVYGFEPVIVALERIRNAIVLSDVPAFEALIQWVKNNCLVGAYTNLGEGSGITIVTEAEIDNETSTTAVVSFDMLLYAIKKLNFNSVVIEPSSYTLKNSDTINIAVTTSNTPNNTTLYWKVIHGTTSDSDFATLSGIVNINGNRGSFAFSTYDDGKVKEPNETFTIELRRGSATGPVLTTSGVMTISAHTGLAGEYPMRYFTEPSFMSPTFERSATSLFITETIRPVPVRTRINDRILR